MVSLVYQTPYIFVLSPRLPLGGTGGESAALRGEGSLGATLGACSAGGWSLLRTTCVGLRGGRAGD